MSALVLAFLVLGAPQGRALPMAPPQGDDARAWDGPLTPGPWLVIDAVDAGGRRPFRPDAVFARYLLDPASDPPSVGEEVSGERGARLWEVREPNEKGDVDGPVGWAWAAIDVEQDMLVLARPRRVVSFFVNGAGHAGDIYGSGYGPVPVALRAGRNHVFVSCRRGSGFRLTFDALEAGLRIASNDVTRPDLYTEVGDAEPRVLPRSGLASVLVMNAGSTSIDVLAAETGGTEWFSPQRLDLSRELPPLWIGKLGVTFAPDPAASSPFPEEAVLSVRLLGADDRVLATTEVALRLRKPDEPRRMTFRSGIDDSVQEYSVLPPSEDAGHGDPGLVLTLHGAGVDAFGQARSYSAKPDLVVVAPTNRRPFGFDWQDWGRLDAYEVLARGIASFDVDTSRIYLTGHSMGGHGSWHLAANDPDRFAAVGPSAGWASFDSYGGRPDGELAGLWHAADGASSTLALLPNLVQVPAYILHGDADDNVPASEARAMERALTEAGAGPRVHYEPDAGHWWNGDRSTGADCVDWPPMFELFAASRVQRGRAQLDFVTVDPAVDARHDWVEVRQALRYGQPVRVTGTWDAAEGRISLTTENARRLVVDSPGVGGARCEIDGDVLSVPERGRAHFVRSAAGESWRDAGGRSTAGGKSPERSGPFKRAFDRDFVLVYATGGDDSEDAEALARARYDGQVWWYRANGGPSLVSDADWLAGDSTDTNVILYGNADTNLAWERALGTNTPLQVTRSGVQHGHLDWEGDDLGVLFVHPREGHPDALVGVVGWTGTPGARIGYTLPLFVSGVGYPDYVVFDAEVLSDGDGGVRSAGWFDALWALDGHGFVRDESPRDR